MKSRQFNFSTGSIRRNVVDAALPLLAAQALNPLYNIVDRIYIGKIPGEGVRRIMVNAYFMLLLTGAVMTAIGIVCRRPILYAFGASAETYPYAAAHLPITCAAPCL